MVFLMRESSQFRTIQYEDVGIELTMLRSLRQVPTVQPVATLPVTETAPTILDANVNTGIPSVAPMTSIASMASIAPIAPIASAAPAAPAAAPADSSADMPINPTTIAIPAFPVTPPQPPADLTLTTAAVSPVAGQIEDPSVFVTVQWLETWIGGTSRTWLPHTITLYQGAPARTGPLPGKGEIGMGTLTGELGITQTVVQGGAMTAGPEWKMGAVAAVGLGVAGII